VSALARRLLPDTADVGADGWLTVGGCSIETLAGEFGTPLFVYDELHLRARCREAVEAFGHERAVYATKAFLCRAMARLAYEEGMLLDVASGGELHVALEAGVPASSCVLHGNNKSVAELREAIVAGVRHIVVDSFDELDRLDLLRTERVGPAPDVLLRITPGVHAHTHEFIATGQDDSKFGFNLSLRTADAARSSARRAP
jgi:diaminopimelate decarboxylase